VDGGNEKVSEREIGELLDRLIEILDAEPDPVKQQAAIEMLTTRHAFRMGQRDMAVFVAGAMHKHAVQLLGQIYSDEPEPAWCH
jgi:hypothetical protein